MNTYINQLIRYGLQKGLITEYDCDYAVNLLLDLFHLDYFAKEEVSDESLYVILDHMLDYACAHHLCEDDITHRDLFDTRIMNCLMPRPNEVIRKFNQLKAQSPRQATDYFYRLSIASNYIRMNRVKKNIRYIHKGKYGPIEITINLSKPEKDPKAIAAARNVKSSGYPECLLCKENVGFAGDMKRPARETHRVIPLSLAGDRYYLQYSPYVYYNEHCIVFNEKHVPMKIDHHTFTHLMDFITQFPDYMLGSNADLPIVGGSILTHDHYQGGRYHFPIQDAKVLKTYHWQKTTIEMLYWPLSAMRMTSDDPTELIDLADTFLKSWRGYDNLDLEIIAHDGTLHNTITPIARRAGQAYQLDLVFRNNRTSEKYPLGIFHPHPENYHIKKENIGLIEVMGLAILPARLKTELQLLKECLLGKRDITKEPTLKKHEEWFHYLMTKKITNDNVDAILKEELAIKFTSVLENAGVFKMDDEGIDAFDQFIRMTLERK